MDALKPVVLLEAFYRRGTAGVPCPADGESVDWWWDHLAKQANELQKDGFTAIWLPPITKGSVGTGSVGYDAGHFDMSLLDHAGLAGVDPLHAVTFVENHDTDCQVIPKPNAVRLFGITFNPL